MFTENKEERVEVNQRHLIDKILARYSAEFTVFRELIQNSADASCSAIEIYFLTNDQCKMESILFGNNGRLFTNQDWDRLKKIAEGNPDEDKIGFFGVGFYSLFSLCEEPIVVSGKKSIKFVWKGDQLYVRTSQDFSSFPTLFPPNLNELNLNSWTWFVLRLRDITDVVDFDEFGQFLVTSLLFTTSLTEARVFLNTNMQLAVNKSKEVPKTCDFAKSDVISPQKIFKIESLEVEKIIIQVEKLYNSKPPTSTFKKLFRWAWTGTEVYEKQGKFSLFMRIAKCRQSTKLPTETAKKMERTTKKKPPSSVTSLLMFLNLDEWNASDRDNPIFKRLVLGPSQQGQIYIGFPTFQTTGCAVHLSSAFIPTVERETIDFVDPILQQWNVDLLSSCGALFRIIYNHEMENLSEPRNEKAVFLMNVFQFSPSTPHGFISSVLKDNFFDADVRVPTTKGIKWLHESCSCVQPELESLLTTVNILPSKLAYDAPAYINCLNERKLIRPVEIRDIVNECYSRPFTIDEGKQLLKWCVKDPNGRTVLSYLKFDNFGYFSSFSFFSPPGIYSKDCPLPVQTAPVDLTCSFQDYELEKIGLVRLPMINFIQFFLSTPFTVDQAESFLSTISKRYNSLNEEEQCLFLSQSASVKCIPTVQGLEKPEDAYLPGVKWMDELALVSLKKKSIPDWFLVAMGVRSAPKLSVVFESLDSLKWDQAKLFKYLCSMKDDLAPNDWSKLKMLKMFSRKNEPNQKYCANELYFPLEENEKIGLPVLEWSQYLQPESQMGQFMSMLGLKQTPPLTDIVQIICKLSDKREILFQFLDSHFNEYSTSISLVKNVAFIPDKSNTKLLTCNQCFSDQKNESLGFPVVNSFVSLRICQLLGIRPFPGPDELIYWLSNFRPLPEIEIVLEYLADMISLFSRSQKVKISEIPFIPIKEKLYQPCQVYFYSSDFAEIFPCIENYSEKSKLFLTAVGVKDEPTPNQIVKAMTSNARGILEKFGQEKYLLLLQRMASANIDSSLLKSWGRSCSFLAIDGDRYVLAKLRDIVLNDDSILYKLFVPLISPPHDSLETFYEKMGCLWLSQAVASKFTPQISKIPSTPETIELQKLIQTRSELLCLESTSTKQINRITVNRADGIGLTLNFRGQMKQQITTAYYDEKSNILYVVLPYNMLHVSQRITFALYSMPRLHQILLISTLLTTSLETLGSMGYPVEKLMKKMEIRREFGKDDETNIVKAERSIIEKNIVKSESKNLQKKEITAASEPDNIRGESIIAKRDVNDKPNEFPDNQNSFDPNDFFSKIGSIFKQKKQPTLQFDNLKKSLEWAVKSSRASNANQINNFSPPMEPRITDTCEAVTEESLSLYANVLGMNVYSASNPEILDSLISQVHSFASLLLIIAGIFDLDGKACHIFYDQSSNTVAFNRSGSLFFNLSYYVALNHENEFNKAGSYWYLTMCHELSHNLVQPHDAQFASMFKSFADNYMDNFKRTFQ